MLLHCLGSDLLVWFIPFPPKQNKKEHFKLIAGGVFSEFLATENSFSISLAYLHNIHVE